MLGGDRETQAVGSLEVPAHVDVSIEVDAQDEEILDRLETSSRASLASLRRTISGFNLLTAFMSAESDFLLTTNSCPLSMTPE